MYTPKNFLGIFYLLWEKVHKYTDTASSTPPRSVLNRRSPVQSNIQRYTGFSISWKCAARSGLTWKNRHFFLRTLPGRDILSKCIYFALQTQAAAQLDRSRTGSLIVKFDNIQKWILCAIRQVCFSLSDRSRKNSCSATAHCYQRVDARYVQEFGWSIS